MNTNENENDTINTRVDEKVSEFEIIEDNEIRIQEIGPRQDVGH